MCHARAPPTLPQALVDYQITIMTSDIKGAGTDGDVYIALKVCVSVCAW